MAENGMLGMPSLATDVTAGAGGLRDLYMRYAEAMSSQGQQPLPPAEFLKMLQMQQQQQQQAQQQQVQPGMLSRLYRSMK